MINVIRNKRISIFMIVAYLLVTALTLIFGETAWNDVWKGAMTRYHSHTFSWNPLLDERLPRMLVLSCTGASLPVAGIVMQAIFRNPLASPSILGLSAGASLGAVCIFITGWKSISPCTLPLATVCGAFLTLVGVYNLGRFKSTHTFILAGMAISSLMAAGQDFLLQALRHEWELLQTLAEWQAGFTGHVNWQHVCMQFPLTSLGLVGCWIYRKEIDLFSFGEEHAAALGVDIAKTRWRLFLCVALLTGSSIAVLGIIPFLGLILPHTMRFLYRPTSQELIPWSALGGAFLLVGIDLALRYFALSSVSISNLTAIIGGLFFLYLFLKPSSVTQC